MRSTKILKSGDPSEFLIQKTIVDYVKHYPSIFKYLIHIPNEGKRSTIFGRILKSIGMRKGVSDLFIALPRHGYHGLWIELKSKNGRLSLEQKEFLNDMSIENYYTWSSNSIDETIKLIAWYCEIAA